MGVTSRHEYNLDKSWYLRHSMAKPRLRQMCQKAAKILKSSS